MEQHLFSTLDISEEQLIYADYYLKTVIINAKRHYYNRQVKKQKYGIVFVDMESYPEDLWYEDDRFDKVLCQYIRVKGISVPVYDPELSDALLALTEIQRSVLLENVVLEIPMKQIALEFEISERMVRKHKHNAIIAIQRRLMHRRRKIIKRNVLFRRYLLILFLIC